MEISSISPQPVKPENIKLYKALEKKAKEFESVFIAESLKHANIGMPKESELDSSLITDTFDSFMTRALADSIVEQGGLGLSKHITKSLYEQFKT